MDTTRASEGPTHIERAVGCFKSQIELAAAIGVSPQQLNQWVKGTRPVAPQSCRAIEWVTKGAVTRYQLRPDIFGSSEDAPPSKVA